MTDTYIPLVVDEDEVMILYWKKTECERNDALRLRINTWIGITNRANYIRRDRYFNQFSYSFTLYLWSYTVETVPSERACSVKVVKVSYVHIIGGRRGSPSNI